MTQQFGTVDEYGYGRQRAIAERTLAEEMDEQRSVTEYGLAYLCPQPGEFIPQVVPDLSRLPRFVIRWTQLVCTQELVSDLVVGEWAARLVLEWPPILVRRSSRGELLVLDGHHRVCAAAPLGIDVVCAVLGDSERCSCGKGILCRCPMR